MKIPFKGTSFHFSAERDGEHFAVGYIIDIRGVRWVFCCRPLSQHQLHFGRNE